MIKSTKHITISLAIAAIALLYSCKKEEPVPEKPAAPTADFSYSGAGVPAPASVQFTNMSTNANSYSWDFGDNGTSADANPSHTYVTGGVYTVRLTATGTGGSISTSKTINIASAPTKVLITKITVTAMPFVDGSGSSWDGSSGPDLFFKITDKLNNSLVDATTARVMDITPASLPVYWNFSTPFEVNPIGSERFIDLWDYDSPDADDLIGYVGFPFINYTTGQNPYPSTVTETRNGITIRLDLMWQ